MIFATVKLMKLSLSWIFDHIDGSWENLDVLGLVEKFNTHTAEIEGFKTLMFHKDLFEIGLCKSIEKDKVAFILPSKNSVFLEEQDADKFILDQFYLLRIDDNLKSFRLAKLSDFGMEKNSLFPALNLSLEDFHSGSWKKFLPDRDVVFDFDNKSMTNRPDLWSSRGIAREFAMLLNLPLKKKEDLLFSKKTKIFTQPHFELENFSFKNFAPEVCSAFSLTKLCDVQNSASCPKIAFRLAIIGVRPHSMIVDLTNYVMYDWGSPSHAYDADLISNAGDYLCVRNAKDSEKLTLLDGEELDLVEADLVIASTSAAVGLAGIKGGVSCSIFPNTKNVLLEVAIFQPSVIRRSSIRHKVRTDASARFEKSLDPEMMEQAVARFLFLASESGLKISSSTDIYCYKPQKEQVIIKIEKSVIDLRAGISFEVAKIQDVLEKLEYGVEVEKVQGDTIFTVQVPSFRSTKNVLNKEDVFEEIVRCIGFEKIPSLVASISREPYKLEPILSLRSIKKYLAFCGAQEQANYVFYDESFLHGSGLFEDEKNLKIINPVSENNFRLVTSLIPNLLLNVLKNFHTSDSFKFFELAKIWPFVGEEYLECKVVSGVFVDKEGLTDFYGYKKIVDGLANISGKKEFTWKAQKPLKVWEEEASLAEIFLEDSFLGRAGMLSQKSLDCLGFENKAKGFFFELFVDPLLEVNFSQKIFKPISRFQGSYFDLSIIVPFSLTVEQIQNELEILNPLVEKVRLLDVFEKKEWGAKRSLAFRLYLQSFERSIEKNDIDKVHSEALVVLQRYPEIVVRL